MGQYFKIYIRATLLLCFFVVSYSQSAGAMSCFPPPLTNIDIIRAPVIFSGTAKEVIYKNIKGTDQDGGYVRYEVTKMYKGPNVKTIDIAPSFGSRLPSHITESKKSRIFIPGSVKNGDLILSICSKANRGRNRWEPIFKNAYNSPFPTMYLLITAFATHQALLIGIVIFTMLVFLRRYFLFKKGVEIPKFCNRQYLVFTVVLLSFYILYLIPAFTLYFLDPDEGRGFLKYALSGDLSYRIWAIMITIMIVLSILALYSKFYKTAVLFILIPSIFILILTVIVFLARNTSIF